MIAPTNPNKPWDTDLIAGRVEHDCVHVHGFPQCMGAAARGDGNCTCRSLATEEHQAAVSAAWTAHRGRRGKMCGGCLFRSRNPEDSYQIRQLALRTEPVYCHHGMPVFGVGGQAQRDCFAPLDERLYPICTGWKKANAPAPEPFYPAPLMVVK